MGLSFIFGADLVPTPSNYDLFTKGELDKLIDKGIKDAIFETDHRVYNLELALADEEDPIVKCGPNIIAPTSTIKGIKEFKPSLLTLANNHTRDHDVSGLLSTIDVLDKNGIEHIGAGKNAMEADKPYIFSDKGKKVAVYTCAEHEFTIVSEDLPGANPFDPYESLDRIAQLKAENDYVVVLYHGGKEHYRYPSPMLQKRCRKMLSKGADLVICQHTHCVGCYEEYAGGTVVYGQGNFLFDLFADNEYWQTSILVRAEFGEKMELSYIPICKDGCRVRIASDEEAKEIMEGFYSRTEEIKEKGFVKEKYLEVAKKQFSSYAYMLAGGNSSGREYTEDFAADYAPGDVAAIFNCINCEVHSETIMAAAWDMVMKANEERKTNEVK